MCRIEYFQWHRSSLLYKADYSIVGNSDISFLFWGTFCLHVCSTHCYLFCFLEPRRIKVHNRFSINICWITAIIIWIIYHKSSCTADPLMLFHLTSFRYNVDEKKNSAWGHCLEFARSPHACIIFLQGLQFPPISQRCACQVNCVAKLSQFEWAWVWVSRSMW